MATTESFYSLEEQELSREFVEQGYVVRAVDNRLALDALREHVVEIACRVLECPRPASPSDFLDNIHSLVPAVKLNDLRLSIYRQMNQTPWFRPTYFRLGRSLIETLVGNELAMQNRVNLSIQMPDDDSSLLDIHADVFSGETPFEVVEWLPLVDCYRSKSMFILPHAASKRVTPRLSQLGEGGMARLIDEVKEELVWLDVPYGTVLVFTPNCLHGNIVNREKHTRWSVNCRFTGLFTPYTSFEKKIGSFYLPINTRVVSRIGMAYRHPDGFKE